MVDGSGSMAKELVAGGGVTKADAVLGATREFIGVLKGSRIKDSFWLSAVAFNTTLANMISTQDDFVRITDLDPSLILHPIDVFRASATEETWNTDIGLALRRALEITRNFRRDGSIPIDPKYRRAVVILLSDGQHNVGEPDMVLENARQVSSQWPLCTVAFGSDANMAMLREIATDERHFKQTADPKELREFFVHSSTLQRK